MHMFYAQMCMPGGSTLHCACFSLLQMSILLPAKDFVLHCWSWSHLFGVFEHNHFFSDFLIILTKTVIKYFFNVECIVYYIVIAKAFS